MFNTVLVNDGFGVSETGFRQMRSQKSHPLDVQYARLSGGRRLPDVAHGRPGLSAMHARALDRGPFGPHRRARDGFCHAAAQRRPVQPRAHHRCPAPLHQRGHRGLRWLLWLDQRAATDTKARALRDSLIEAVPADWEAFKKTPPSLPALRTKIIDFARASSAGEPAANFREAGRVVRSLPVTRMNQIEAHGERPVLAHRHRGRQPGASGHPLGGAARGRFVNVLRLEGVHNLLERIYAIDPDVILIDLENPSRDTIEQMFQ